MTLHISEVSEEFWLWIFPQKRLSYAIILDWHDWFAFIPWNKRRGSPFSLGCMIARFDSHERNLPPRGPGEHVALLVAQAAWAQNSSKASLQWESRVVLSQNNSEFYPSSWCEEFHRQNFKLLQKWTLRPIPPVVVGCGAIHCKLYPFQSINSIPYRNILREASGKFGAWRENHTNAHCSEYLCTTCHRNCTILQHLIFTVSKRLATPNIFWGIGFLRNSHAHQIIKSPNNSTWSSAFCHLRCKTLVKQVTWDELLFVGSWSLPNHCPVEPSAHEAFMVAYCGWPWHHGLPGFLDQSRSGASKPLQIALKSVSA